MKHLILRGLMLASLGLPFAVRAEEAMHHGDAGMQHSEHHMAPEQMAAHMRDVLQLRPDQEGALNTLLQALKPATGDDHDVGGPAHEQGMTTPQHLDRMLTHMDAMRSKMAAHATAIKTFYGQLNASQQKAFDAIAPRMLHHHMMMMHPGGMGHPPMGPGSTGAMHGG